MCCRSAAAAYLHVSFISAGISSLHRKCHPIVCSPPATPNVFNHRLCSFSLLGVLVASAGLGEEDLVPYLTLNEEAEAVPIGCEGLVRPRLQRYAK